MNPIRISDRLAFIGISGAVLLGLASGLPWQAAVAQLASIRLATGFTPNPTVLAGTGGGDRPAAAVVNTRTTPTGPCLGYISTTPHETVLLDSNFANLEMRVESEVDTTLIITGPGGVWCNDDSGSPNPAIAGAWLPGEYRVWVGAYRADQTPDYDLFIQAR